MSKVFTDSFINALTPKRGATDWQEVCDKGCRGLRLRVSPSGEKVWALKLQVNGRRIRHTLGAYPAVSLADAREKARQYSAEARSGIAPEEMDARKRAEAMTLTDAHQEYLSTIKATLRPGTITLKEGMFKDHIRPVAGKRLLRMIRRADIIEVVGAVAAKGYKVQANRVFAEVMALLRWCEHKGYIDGVPSLRKKDMRHHGAAREQARGRTLTDAEIQALWASLGSIGALTGDFLRLLLLTGQRRDEVRLMTWEEIDLSQALWTIPASRYKTHLDQVVPLPRQAMDILKARHTDRAKGFVLAGREPGQPFNGAASAIRRLRTQMEGRGDFTLHDLRRTLRTGLSRLGVDGMTAEKVIGHLPQGIQQVYDVHDRLEERRDALQRWADHIDRLAAAKEAGNVFPLRA